MRFQLCCIDHKRIGFVAFACQFHQDVGKGGGESSG